MTARDELERVVPRLRRYARAVLGDAAAADRGVAAALADAVAAPPAPDDVTLGLFRRVHAALRAGRRRSGGAEAALGELAVLDEEVGELAELERNVLLLSALEGFDKAAIARIVEREEGEVEARLAAAYAALDGERRARVLVCPAEPAGGGPLVALVRAAGHEVVATARDGDEAIRRLRETAAELLFADLDRLDAAPGPAALEAVRALDDVGCVAVTEGVDDALARLADTAVVVIAKPVDARLLRVAFAHALRASGRPHAAG
ncbi:MAG: sigma factor-like helix-turn-helix DNA-binding protein [Alphaproteobacteria bacterium]